jgi:hypothetical protein
VDGAAVRVSPAPTSSCTYLSLPEDERRQRAQARWRESPEETFEMTLEDHERWRVQFAPPTHDQFSGQLPRLDT